MIVVSNTTPISSLFSIDSLWLLPKVFTAIHIAEAVSNEVQAGGIILQPDEFIVHRLNNTTAVEILLHDLDRGEAETIILAKELQADVVIIDERLGNRIAQESGLRVIGTLTVLRFAKERGLIDTVRPLLDTIIAHGQWYSPRVYTDFLQSIGE
jgi:predicted nucleic acid-binding protein